MAISATAHKGPRSLMGSEPRADHFFDLVDDLIDALEIPVECDAGELMVYALTTQ